MERDLMSTGMVSDLALLRDFERVSDSLLSLTLDYCLAHFLRGVVLRFIAHPEPHVVARPEKSQIPIDEADEQALISFK